MLFYNIKKVFKLKLIYTIKKINYLYIFIIIILFKLTLILFNKRFLSLINSKCKKIKKKKSFNNKIFNKK